MRQVAGREVLHRHAQPGRGLGLPEGGAVATRVDAEYVGYAGAAQCGVKALVHVQEAVVALADVKGDQGGPVTASVTQTTTISAGRSTAPSTGEMGSVK